MSVVLNARGVTSGYHGQPVVSDLDLEVHSGKVTALLGPNGAGKTTTLLTLAGEISPMSGEVEREGFSGRASLSRCAREGLALVTEERSVFMDLTVAENLRVGRCDESVAVELFPELEALMGRKAGLLSGGEQQMLTLGRALGRGPRMLLIDELSLGLAPLVVGRLLTAVRAAADEGIAVLLVEQHVEQAMRVADYVYLMDRGRVALKGEKEDVAGRVHEIEAAYLASAKETRSGSASGPGS
jgi:branched-chain amino acid transport system ATP-binding protein